MARRKAKPKRRTKNTINVLNIAESVMIANLATTNILGVNMKDFLFAGSGFSGLSAGGYQSGKPNHNYVITLRELLRGEQFPSKGGVPVPFGTAITLNLKNNAMPLIAGAILIPVGFKLVKKITTKPRATTNRMLKMAGLSEVRV